MIARAASLFALASILAVAGGCSSSSSGNAEPAGSEGALENTRQVEGALKVRLQGHQVTFAFQLSKLDFNARTAVWNAQVLDAGGHTNTWDDVNVASKITRVARCGGCFSVEVPGGTAGGPLAEVDVNDWNVTNIQYEGQEATLIDAEEAANNSTNNNATGGANDVGACTMSCSGSETCKPNVKRSECNVDSGLFPRMRCATTFEFVKGGRCP